MKSSFWATLVLAVACGGKTIEGPAGTDQPDAGPEGRDPVPGEQPPPPVAVAGSVSVGGAPVWGYGGAPAGGMYGKAGASVGGAYPPYGGSVGIGGSIAIGGASGGVPPNLLEGAIFQDCLGVSYLSPDDWVGAPLGPEEIFFAAQGSWFGLVSSPWGSWQVEMHLRADQSYSAYTLSGGGPALYYGSDLDSPLKQWRITDAALIGAAGEIDIIFQYPPEPAYEGYQGYLDCMHLNDSLQRLRFEYWYLAENNPYGPFVFDLYRF